MRHLGVVLLVLVSAYATDARAVRPGKIGDMGGLSGVVSPISATAIFIFHVSAAERLAPTPAVLPYAPPPPLPWPRVNNAAVTITIDEVLRGTLRQHAGKTFVHHAQYGMHCGQAWGGIWCPIPAFGEPVIGLCDDSSDDATALLTDGHCDPFYPAVGYLDDLRAILKLEAEHTPTAAVLKLAREQVASRRGWFASYVESRFSFGPPSPAQVAQLLAIIESPQINKAAKSRYIHVISDLLPREEPPDPANRLRWIRFLFQLIFRPDSEELRENYPPTVLWNAIGLSKSSPYLSEDAVFQSHPAERAAALAFVRGHAEIYWKAKMLDWLTGVPPQSGHQPQ